MYGGLSSLLCMYKSYAVNSIQSIILIILYSLLYAVYTVYICSYMLYIYAVLYVLYTPIKITRSQSAHKVADTQRCSTLSRRSLSDSAPIKSSFLHPVPSVVGRPATSTLPFLTLPQYIFILTCRNCRFQHARGRINIPKLAAAPEIHPPLFSPKTHLRSSSLFYLATLRRPFCAGEKGSQRQHA